MVSIENSERIEGVQFVPLSTIEDGRGWFMETFRKTWFPQRDFERIQWNASFSRAGVLRGLHYHLKQIDYWYVPWGRIQLGLCDLRLSSPTYRAAETLEIGDHKRTGVFIPVGVAHGFLALTDVVMNYLVDNYYDGTDELEVAWDDPDLGLKWDSSSPNVSERDTASPRLKDIPQERRPE